MRNIVIRATLQRLASLAIVFLGVAFFAGAVERAALVHGQEKEVAKKDVAEKDAADDTKKGGPADFFQSPMIVMVAIMILFFFFIILPAQRRQKKEQQSILANLKKNDEVVTAAGIIGIVSLIKENEDEVTLKIDDNARIKVLKSSIVRIKNKEEPKDAAGNPVDVKPST